jgi:hypothetical protein
MWAEGRWQARLAQLVERATFNRKVGGSRPPLGYLLLSYNCIYHVAIVLMPFQTVGR